MKEPMSTAIQLRRIDALGVPFVVLDTIELEGRKHLALAAEAEFDTAMSKLAEGEVTTPRIVWVEEKALMLLPVPDERVEVLQGLVTRRLAELAQSVQGESNAFGS
jgi:hypothetical protein